MRELRKPNFVRHKKLVRTMTFSVVLLVAATLLMSGSITAIDLQGNSTPMKKVNINKSVSVSNGRLPRNSLQGGEGQDAFNKVSLPAGFLGETAYACDIYPNFNTIWFDTDIPGTLNNIAVMTSYDFIAGGTWADGAWYGVEYAAYGNSNFWTIDETNGDMTLIGATGSSEGLNGLAYDDNTGTMYAASGSYLFEIDMGTGAATQIGAFGVTGVMMIGLACDNDGNLYGEDLGTDSLYSVDPDTGAATLIGTLGGINLNYAQDCEYDKNNNVLYLAALTIHAGNEGALYTCDVTTGATTYIGMLGTALTEVAGFAIPYESGPQPDIHDVGIKSINDPDSGGAGADLPVQVTVKNYGNFTETSVPVNVIIGQTTIATTTVFSEDFEGTFPPTGWTLINNGGTSVGWVRNDYWYRPNSAGTGYCADADSDAVGSSGPWPMDCTMITPAFDLSTSTDAVLDFNNYFYLFAGDYCYVDISTDGGSTWTNIMTQGGALYGQYIHSTIDITAYAGSANTMLAFTYYAPGWDYYWEVDDIVVNSQQITFVSQYDETEYITSIAAGVEVIVDFNAWTPDEWQSSDNEDILYTVNAETQLTGDEDSSNDFKTKDIVLSYPFLHDIAVVGVNSPTDDGPGQTLPVSCTIKNIGQFDECCYQTSMNIGTIVLGSVILDEPFTVNDWTVTNTKWSKQSTNYAGGTAPEYRFYYSPSETGTFLLYSPPINTVGISAAQLSWKHMVNHYTTPYTLAVMTSTDATNWEIVWSIDPTASVAATTETITVSSGIGSPTFYIAFAFIGYSWNINYWYVDDVTLQGMSLESEFTDLVCTIELAPGESADLDFDDWTPAALAIGDSDEISYIAQAEQLLPTDTNPDNDVAGSSFTLSYWHDVKVKSITQPSSLGRDPWDLLFSFNLETATGALGNAGAEFDGTYFYSTRWATNLIHQFDNTGTLVKEFSIAGVSGLRDLAYNEDTGYFYGGAAAGTIWVMDFDSETLISTLSGSFQSRAIGYNSDDDVIYCSNWADPVWVVDPATGTIISQFNLGTATSTYGFAYDNNPDTGKMLYVFDQGSGAGYPQYIYEWDLDGGVMTGFTYDVASDFPASSGIAGGLFVNSGFVPGKLIIGGCLQGTPDMMFAYELRTGGTGGGGYPPITVWVAPGNQQVEAIVGNEGTFEETGLICYGTLYQYIDDPENGTLVWDDSIANIDLDPLGDEETVPFGSVNFNMQGPWGLYIELPLATDDVENNNLKSLGIGVDDTNPTSSHTLSPASPDGLNGWYISDVTVTLDAEDGTQDWQSGVDVIKYKVGSGAVQTINGDHGTFKIENDGEDIPVEYWAIDNVGNEETPHHTFTIDMDQTKPQITLEYEVTGGGPLEGWEFTFTATATDETSGMERVEFYFNGVLQETVTGSGPTYVWVIEYIPVPQAYFKAVGYDMAGLNDFYQIENPDPRPHSNQQNVQPMTTIKINLGR